MKLITAPAAGLVCIMLMGASCTRTVRECTTTPVTVEVPVPVRVLFPPELTEAPDQSMCGAEIPVVGVIRTQRRQACAELEKCAARLEVIREPQGD